MNPGRSCRCHPHQCTTARRQCRYVVDTTTEWVGGWGVCMSVWVVIAATVWCEWELVTGLACACAHAYVYCFRILPKTAIDVSQHTRYRAVVLKWTIHEGNCGESYACPSALGFKRGRMEVRKGWRVIISLGYRHYKQVPLRCVRRLKRYARASQSTQSSVMGGTNL